jgi:hypothetical protein
MAVHKLQCLQASTKRVYSKYTVSVQQVYSEYTASVKHVLEIVSRFPPPQLCIFVFIFSHHFAFLVIPRFEVTMPSVSSLIPL